MPKRKISEETEQPSRSAKKRASTALQKLGEQLAALSAEKRTALNLPEDLTQALAMNDRLTDREAARRQRQFIGRLMREAAPELVNQIRNALDDQPDENRRIQQKAEKLRQGLLDLPDGELEAAALDLEPEAARAALLIAAVRKAKAAGTTPQGRRAYREIFRLLASQPNL